MLTFSPLAASALDLLVEYMGTEINAGNIRPVVDTTRWFDSEDQAKEKGPMECKVESSIDGEGP